MRRFSWDTTCSAVRPRPDLNLGFVAASDARKPYGRNGKPGLIKIDKSGANKSGSNQFNSENNRRIKIRQCKYLNNIVEQEHRRVKRLTRSMLGLKSFPSAQSTLAGIELVAMLRKGQIKEIWSTLFRLQSSSTL